MSNDRLKELQAMLKPVIAPLTIEEHARGFSEASLNKYLRERCAGNDHALIKEVHDRCLHVVKLADEAIKQFWADRGLTVAQAATEPTPLWESTRRERDKLEKVAADARKQLEVAAHNLGISEEAQAIQSRQLAKDKAARIDAAQHEIAAREAALTAALAEMPEL
jgi:hypothetical protein